MRRLVAIIVLVAGVVGVNAIVDSQRQCQCDNDCWCKTPWGRHVRWFVPIGHKLG